MVLKLRRYSERPMYLQIKEALRSEIVSGTFPNGTYLPSSRQLSQELGVSRITVTNAFAELEADGFVQGDSRRGVFVLPLWEKAVATPDTSAEPTPGWQQSLSKDPGWASERMRLDLLWRTRKSGTIPFNALRHDLCFLPANEFRNSLNNVLREDGGIALDYEANAGYLPLRQTLSQYLRHQGIQAEAEDVIITSGGQQAIDLLCQAFVHPGDTVVMENPTYPNALTAFKVRHARVVGVPVDADGMRIDILRQLLERESPRLIYTVPTFHNPTGAIMSATRRRELVLLAHEYGVPVLEDDYMREIRFGSPIPPPVASFDRYGNIIHIGTFSKSLMPALRLGYVVARGALRERLIMLKRTADICSSSLIQRALNRYLTSGEVHKHWKRVSRLCRRRQMTMVAALERYFPKSAQWSVVEGGFAIWVSLPQDVSARRLLNESLKHNVSFAPGELFFIEPADQPFMRLGFAPVNEDQIERGIKALGNLIRQQSAKGGIR
ncbi:MAG TPA: PLP-dependent aminotransferase family protein [Dehalococcoidia bacterium]|nr:PLP-dependent aminotransferase family protein [Dehalococcoidia bacterium]